MKVGFIGAGKMAYALCKGFITAALVKPSDILVSDINRVKLRSMRELGVQTTLCNKEVTNANEVVYIAVKPYTVSDILGEISTVVNKHHLIVSIAAGITTSTMEKLLPEESRTVRVMPNTPSVVQTGASVFTRGSRADDSDGDLVREMLSCVGLVEEMPEHLMDAVTGLSGNGPAYGFVVIQALADGGVKMGLNRDQATRLAAQSMLGAAKMVLETKIHPEQLKDDICSPAGTSIHALHAMERLGLRGILVDGVQAGAHRSKELGEGDKKLS